jgi:hypothetical protein
MPEANEHQISVAARLEQLTALYERCAYLVYNVAARVAVDPGASQTAARRAVLAQVADTEEERLAADVARLGIEEAVAVDPRALGEPVLSANARLSPPERAVLALWLLAEASDELAGSALGLDTPAVEELRGRALQNLATLLRVDAAQAEASYRELPWAEPPPELWQALYPELHGAVSQNTRAVEAQQVRDSAPKRSRRQRAGGLLRPLRRLPGWMAILVLLLAAGGVAMAARGGDDSSGGSDDSSSAYDYGSSGSDFASDASGDTLGDSGSTDEGGGYDALTPEELDKLRKDELEDLKRYSKEQADKRLSPSARRNAGRRAGDLVKLARRRERAAAKRELALRRQLVRERAARIRERRQAARERDSNHGQDQPGDPQPQPQPQPDDQRPDDQQPDDPPADDGSDGTSAECLYDEQSGNYICPE